MNKVKDRQRIGSMWLGEDTEIFIEQDKKGNFINPEDEIKDWVHYLNNPWSGTSISYQVIPKYSEGGWMAVKVIVVYDTVDAKIYANGTTPQEAITACDEAIKILTKKYYKEENNNE